MNYEDVLPPNWVQIIQQSARIHQIKVANQNPHPGQRYCLNPQTCPLSRPNPRPHRTICMALTRCIQNYPTEQHLTHFK